MSEVQTDQINDMDQNGKWPTVNGIEALREYSNILPTELHNEGSSLLTHKSHSLREDSNPSPWLVEAAFFWTL